MCYVAYNSLKAVSTNSWYFDSGCSKHMTGDKIFLKDYKTIDVGHVTFVDGVKVCVLGKRTLDFEGLPRLKNVLHVEGLAANLISISQLCNQNLLVKFTKNTCKIFNDSQECVLEGARSFDNCYKLLQPHTCHMTSLDEIEIWHQRLGPLNYKNLTQIGLFMEYLGLERSKMEFMDVVNLASN